MTYEEYINNPMGKHNAVLSKRDMYYEFYSKKLDLIMVRENGKIDFKQYVDTKHDKYYLYIKIPSEVIANFYYDVVIEFYTNDPTKKGTQILNGYDVRFFSNDPAFVFTFAHAFMTEDLFIKELSRKMSKPAIKKVAEERNPKEEIGYVKSLFFAYLIIKKRGLLNKRSYLGCPPMNFNKLTPLIMHADKKIFLRQEAQQEYNKRARQEKKKEQNKDKSEGEIKEKVLDKTKKESLSSVIKKAQTTKSVTKISAIKKVNKSKKIAKK